MAPGTTQKVASLWVPPWCGIEQACWHGQPGQPVLRDSVILCLKLDAPEVTNAQIAPLVGPGGVVPLPLKVKRGWAPEVLRDGEMLQDSRRIRRAAMRKRLPATDAKFLGRNAAVAPCWRSSPGTSIWTQVAPFANNRQISSAS